MSVKIRLKRFGRRNRACFRINAIDGRTARDGRVIEELGWYDPLASELDKQVSVDRERVEYWLGVGAQPSQTVKSLLQKVGVATKK